MALVVDASVALKWVIEEPDSHLAEALIRSGEHLIMPDFWLAEAASVLWLRVRRKMMTAQDAKSGFALLQNQIKPRPTADLGLHEVALEIGLTVNHSPYDTLYVAFAIAVGAERVVAADSPFVRDMQAHPDPHIANMLLPLAAWAAQQNG